MNILVTGAGGLIGQYAVSLMADNSFKVYALYRSFPPKGLDCHWNIVTTDLQKRDCLSDLRSIKADIVVHCAAVLPALFEGDTAIKAAMINRQIDEHVLEYCQDIHAKLIFISSASLYGGVKTLCKEDSPVFPKGPYLEAKLETELKIKKLIEKYVILRINAPYAPEQCSRTVLRIFIERAIKNLNLIYHGQGQREQDFTNALDIASAILCAVDKANVKGIFNIASGKPLSMKKLAYKVIKNVPKTTSKPIVSCEPDIQEKYHANFDISKALSLLGWAPKITLDEGIKRWIKYLETKNENRDSIRRTRQ
jgi:UDP-glucose 4-epimerase